MTISTRLAASIKATARITNEEAERLRQEATPDNLAVASELDSFAELLQCELRRIPRIRSFQKTIAELEAVR